MNTVTIRKNASKKINALLAQATKVVQEQQQRDYYTDCFDTVELTSSIEDVKEFMSDSYYNLSVSLTSDEDGQPVELVVTTNGWSKNDFIITFGAVEPEQIETVEVEEKAVKPRMTFTAVQVFIKSGFVSPLNHGVKVAELQEDKTKQIVKINVVWSELNSIDTYRNEEISIEEYNRLAWLAVNKQKKFVAKTGEGYGYDKTKLEITLGDGQVCVFRHDISIKSPTLQGSWNDWVNYCYAMQEARTAKIH